MSIIWVHESGLGDTASSSYPQTEDTFKDDEFDPEMCIQSENNYFEAKL